MKIPHHAIIDFQMQSETTAKEEYIYTNLPIVATNQFTVPHHLLFFVSDKHRHELTEERDDLN